eukprot:GHVU01222620.1.p5 GENE.GHVU01222620.1~~GHVU01222620.1.p5  ORF type:complete len:129 (-),score=26.23 GHVU01222620.1:1376-1762(-)
MDDEAARHSPRGGRRLTVLSENGSEDERTPNFPRSPMKKGFTRRINEAHALGAASASSESVRAVVKKRINSVLDDAVPVAKKVCQGDHRCKMLEMEELTHLRQHTQLDPNVIDALQASLLEDESAPSE